MSEVAVPNDSPINVTVNPPSARDVTVNPPSARDVTVTSLNTNIVRVGTFVLSGRSDSYYMFVQNTPSDTWIINHNLGKKPSITIQDSSESLIFADIKYLNDNQIQVNFNGPVSGKAYLN